ncbi:MAG: SprT family zinc-dependent metalloprotease [Eubacteriales bacterium]|nr:SprT family zinc-dependent metalloprotease [Eubacteriales bacterium]
MIEKRIPYTLVRSARRTLSLSLDPNGSLIARAPYRMAAKEIEAFISQKAGWIETKQAMLKKRAESVQDCTLQDGSTLPFLGGKLLLRYGATPQAVEKDGILFLPSCGSAKAAILQWLAAEAAHRLPPRVEQWALRMNVYPTALSLGYAKTRWGSMASTGAMRLNIALLHCPNHAIDYVIVHELSHRVHPNHSKAFHAYVESVLPGANQIRAQMKEMSPYLSLLRS